MGWVSGALGVVGGVLKETGKLGYYATGLSLLLQTKINTALSGDITIPIDISVAGNASTGNVTINAEGNFGNATMKTSGDWGHGNYTSSGLLGSGNINWGNWLGWFNLTSEGAGLQSTIAATPLSGQATIKDNIYITGQVNGTVFSFENTNAVLQVGPYVLFGASTALYSLGMILEKMAVQLEKKDAQVVTIVPARRDPRGYELLNAGSDSERDEISGAEGFVNMLRKRSQDPNVDQQAVTV